MFDNRKRGGGTDMKNGVVSIAAVVVVCFSIAFAQATELEKCNFDDDKVLFASAYWTKLDKQARFKIDYYLNTDPHFTCSAQYEYARRNFLDLLARMDTEGYRFAPGNEMQAARVDCHVIIGLHAPGVEKLGTKIRCGDDDYWLANEDSKFTQRVLEILTAATP